MIQYLVLVKDEGNDQVVTDVLRPIMEGDILTDEVIQRNLSQLQLLLSIGEKDVFDAVVSDLQEDESYKKHMWSGGGS
jgi:hypothetical protein